jgi:penicillin-binding protein 2
MSDLIENPQENKFLVSRLNFFYVSFSLVFFIFFARLWYLQILEGEKLRSFSDRNHIKRVSVQALRGFMLDREGQILVGNKPGFELLLHPQFLQDLDEAATLIAPIINLDAEAIKTRYTRMRRQHGRFTPVRIKDNLSREEVFRLKRLRLELAGLEVQEKIIRDYPLTHSGAQLFGYMGEINEKQVNQLNQKYPKHQFRSGDIVGQSGLEELLEPYVRGYEGVQFTQVDVFGRQTLVNLTEFYGTELRSVDPIPGHNVVLTLDYDLQKALHDSMIRHNRMGAAVVINKKGEILAMVSEPSFDPNLFSTGISAENWRKLVNHPFKPLRNKVIQDPVPPGSTFKSYVAIAALQERIIQPSTFVSTPFALRFGGRDYHDHLKGGFGSIDVFGALERSSNVFFYKMGIGLGIDKMFRYISRFGLGQRTNLELAREARGVLPSRQWKWDRFNQDWQPGENLSVAIGQGFVTTTAIQQAVAYLAIGLEGQLVRPHLLKRVEDFDGNLISEFPQHDPINILVDEKGEKVFDREHFQTVKEALRRVVNGSSGTARGTVRLDGVQIAGKTGTSQVRAFTAQELFQPCDTRPKHLRHHGWFVGYAPHDKPDIGIAVLAEHACSGSRGAGPIARDLMLAYFKKYRAELNVKEPAWRPPPSAEATESSEE